MPKPGVIGPAQASDHLKQGINLIADLLAPTLGPVGGLVANEMTSTRRLEMLADSATIVRRILSLGDQRRDIGAMLMRNLVWRVTQQAGDGGALAAVLARALYRAGLRLVAAGANPVQIAQGVEQAVSVVLEALQGQAQPVQTEDRLAAMALTIVQEKPLAAVLGEMSYLLGPDAHVIIEDYVAPFLRRRYIAGAHYPAEIASMYFYTDPPRKRAVVTDSLVALVEDPIRETDQVLPILQAAWQKGKKGLTILAPSISEAALGLLLANQQAGENKRLLLAAKLKDVAEERLYAVSDLALLTGAARLGSHYERTPATMRPDDLGYARRIELAGGSLIAVTDHYARPELQAEVTRLRNRLHGLPLDAEERPLLVKRLAALSGGVGELKIGAAGKQEREVRHHHAERALKVLSAAQRGGVVAGGGAALYHCLPALQGLSVSGDASLGVQLVAQALVAPLQQILHNAWVPESSLIIQQIGEAGPPATFDVLSGHLVDAHQAGLLDAAEVLKTVVRTAASGALSALKTEAIVYHRNPEAKAGLEP